MPGRYFIARFPMKRTLISTACALALCATHATARDTLGITDPTVLQRGFGAEQSFEAGAPGTGGAQPVGRCAGSAGRSRPSDLRDGRRSQSWAQQPAAAHRPAGAPGSVDENPAIATGSQNAGLPACAAHASLHGSCPVARGTRSLVAFVLRGGKTGCHG